jgi:hypothetical protein
MAGKLTLAADEVNRRTTRYRRRVQRHLAAVVAAAGIALAVQAGTATAAAPKTPAEVARAWSKALNAGNDRAAGALFARNALAIQGSFIVQFATAKLAALWHSGLPCAGKIVKIEVKGNVATATFTLGHRKGHTCDGTGERAAARFTVVHGKITRWEQVPPEPVSPLA